MRVLIVGEGGREHALAWKIAQSSQLTKLFCAPGNPGTSSLAENVAIPVSDLPQLVQFATAAALDLVVVGPELPLSMGLADRLREAGIAVVGPSQAAAQLESSKSFAKSVMDHLGVPTAAYHLATCFGDALQLLARMDYPLVIKADGLASGKGVLICADQNEGELALRRLMVERDFGQAGSHVVFESFLVGEEASFIALTDGVRVLPLASSQDHKRVFDGDRGPNTGGMGAYSPAPVVDARLERQIVEQIIQPVVDEMRRRQTPLVGFLYAGLMVTEEGPQVLEFNVRLGDPETQPLMMRLKSDLLPVLVAAAHGRLGAQPLEWYDTPALCVVMASEGYPDAYEKGRPISGVPEDNVLGQSVVFHAGTRLADGRLETNGGRVLGVTARGRTLAEAAGGAYSAVQQIAFAGAHFRSDIGYRAL